MQPQAVGERIYYLQEVVNDTINSAVWSTDPAGPDLSNQIDTSTSSKIMFQSNQAGSYTLKVVLQLASGQELIGEGKINVVPSKV